MTRRAGTRSKRQLPAWSRAAAAALGCQHRTQHAFDERHRLDPGGPITGTPDTRLTAVAFANDPQLTTIETPTGSVRSLAVVGVTHQELTRMKPSSTAHVLAELASTSTP